MLNEKYTNARTLAGYISVIVALTKRLAGQDEDCRKVYEELGAKNTKEWKDIAREDGRNELNANQAEVFMDWDKMISSLDLDLLSPLQKVFVLLYTEIPVRRLEFRNLVLGKGTKEQNYYLDGKFYLNDYKTVRSHGQEIITLTDKLRDALDEYITLADVKRGDKIFGDISSSSFGSRVATAFKKGTGGKRITVTSLRRMYATKKANEKMTFNERKKLAEDMGTSLEKLEGTYNKSASLDKDGNVTKVLEDD
jgi:hypothetical protein